MFEPRILLMDEPLSALDKQLREHMQIELRRLHDQLGMTTVYVTHDQREALTMSDRIAVINHGRIMQLDAPRRIYERPANRFVAEFIGESTFLPVDVASGARAYARAGADRCRPRRRRRPGRCLLMLRPERLRILDGGAQRRPNMNVCTARCSDVVYQGDSCLLQVAARRRQRGRRARRGDRQRAGRAAASRASRSRLRLQRRRHGPRWPTMAAA